MIARTSLEPYISGSIRTKTRGPVHVGKGVIVEEGAEIIADSVHLGDFSYIGKGVRIAVEDFSIGDYSKLHAYSFCYGRDSVSIGNCCWIGGNVVLDAMGGLHIEDGVGIGSHSQIWTHMKCGDIVQGCKYNFSRLVTIKEDAWLVGHCLVSPVQIGARSMAMLGSVITKDMEADHTYAGVPAKDVTDVFGPQFEFRTPEQKQAKLEEIVETFYKRHPHYRGALEPSDLNAVSRTYIKTYSPAEILFMREHVPLVKLYERNLKDV